MFRARTAPLTRVRRLTPGWAVVIAAAGLALPGGAAADTTAATAGNVTTAAYGNLRDDWDPNEPALTPAAVASSSFGQIFSTQLQGSIYAQPLVYDGDVIVTTEAANAYSVDASTGAIVWQRNFGTALQSSAADCTDIATDVGSTSTPVIDPATGVVYLTTRTVTGAQSLADSHWYLQAISAATGQEQPGFPVEIKGTPYNTPGVPFTETNEEQRPGLLLLGGVVYIAFGSDCDNPPYRGVVVGVDESSGQITTMWSDEAGVGTSANSQAGIWQSGGGLVSTGPGQITLATGNGVSPSPAASNHPPSTLSESVVTLTVGPDGRLTPTQFFSPFNASSLDEFDEDLGAGGPIALPAPYFGTPAMPQLDVEVGKDGNVFLLNAANLGGYRQGFLGGNAVVQQVGPYNGVWGHPAAYGGQGGWVYMVESEGGGELQAFKYGVNGFGQPSLSPAALTWQTFGFASGSPLVTSTGTAAGSQVVWAVYIRLQGYSSAPPTYGQLMAFSGTNQGWILPLLWSAPIGAPSEFATPTASGGIVYVGNAAGQLLAFGPSASAPIQAGTVQLGSIPVGSVDQTTLTIDATRPFKITGRLLTDGLQGLAPPQLPSRALGRTAGPELIHPSGEAPIPRGVIAVEQPRRGQAIAAGSRLRLRVRFAPRRPGPVEGFFTLHTTAGPRTISFTGYATAPGVAVSAMPLTFGDVSTSGGAKSLTLSFTNSWSHRERITGYTIPSPPFTVRGLPRVGTWLGPQQAITVTLTFAPRGRGTYASRIAIRTDHGSATLATNGHGVRGVPHIKLGETSLPFGAVPVGGSRTLTFRIHDTGAIPLTITRAIPPAPPFAADPPLAEGISVDPGLAIRVRVTFTPTARGRFAGVYRLDSDGQRGYLYVHFTGRGT